MNATLHPRSQVTHESEVSSHDHNAQRALRAGHTSECETVTGFWTTVCGVGVNWPTLRGRPDCTCGREPGLVGRHEEV